MTGTSPVPWFTMSGLKTLTFLCPTKIYSGVNSHEKIREIVADWGVKRILFLSDPNVVSTEIYTRVENIFRENHIEFEIFTDIEADPSATTVEKAYGIYRTIQASALLTI